MKVIDKYGNVFTLEETKGGELDMHKNKEDKIKKEDLASITTEEIKANLNIESNFESNRNKLFQAVAHKYDQLIIDLLRAGLDEEPNIVELVQSAGNSISEGDFESFKYFSKRAVRLMAMNKINLKKGMDIVSKCVESVNSVSKGITIPLDGTLIISTVKATLMNKGFKSNDPIIQILNKARNGITKENIEHFKFNMVEAIRLLHKENDLDDAIEVLKNVYEDVVGSEMDDNNEGVSEMKTNENKALQPLYNNYGVNLIKADNVYHAATIVNSLSNTLITGSLIESKSDSLKDVKKVISIGLKANINIVMDYLHIKSAKKFAKLVNYAKDNEIVVNIITKQNHNIEAIEMSENVLYIRYEDTPIFEVENNMERYRIEYCKRASKDLVPMIVNVQLKEEVSIVATGK